MPASKSAKKRVRQNETRRIANRSVKSALRTTIKKFRTAASAGDAAAAAAALKEVQVRVDKTVGKGVIHKKTASRIKARLAANLNKLKAAKPS